MQVLRGWQRLNPDGVSYLDMGRALVENNMAAGYTSYWAPLYGVLAWLAASFAERAGLDRLAGVQGLNLLLFLFNLLACCVFVRSLLRFLHIDADSLGGAATLLLASGTLCFLTVRLGGVTLVTPDLAVSAMMLLVAAWTLKLAGNQLSWRGATGIGAVFGIGYWFKSIFFPSWLVWLGLAVVFLRSTPNWRKWIMTAGAAWLVVAFPLVLKISEAAGRWSIGENARLSYFWYVHGIRNTFWEGDVPGFGQPSHPMKKLLENPKVFYFWDVFPQATFAPWYDPGYWHTGATLRFSAAGLAKAMKENLGRKRGLWKPRLFAPFLLLTIAGLWTGRRLLKEGAIL